MKRSLMILLLTVITVLIICFSVTAVTFANVSEGGSGEELLKEELLENVLLPDKTIVEDMGVSSVIPYSNRIAITATFLRKPGSTRGNVSVKAGRSDAGKMTSTIILQEYSQKKKGYINSSSAKPAVRTKASYLITHGAAFSVSSKKKYRVKITINAKIGKSSHTRSDYRALAISK